MNSTMIAVALPTLSKEFDIARGDAAVLVTIYLAAMLSALVTDNGDGVTTMPAMSTVALILSLGAAANLPSCPMSIAPSEHPETVSGDRTGIG